MVRWNVELKYQTSVDADTENEAYDIAKNVLKLNISEVFGSHCKRIKK